MPVPAQNLPSQNKLGMDATAIVRSAARVLLSGSGRFRPSQLPTLVAGQRAWQEQPREGARVRCNAAGGRAAEAPHPFIHDALIGEGCRTQPLHHLPLANVKATPSTSSAFAGAARGRSAPSPGLRSCINALAANGLAAISCSGGAPPALWVFWADGLLPRPLQLPVPAAQTARQDCCHRPCGEAGSGA